ncbi:hypothetical protein EW026_g7644, partial [Hermanssonia centrifuga]
RAKHLLRLADVLLVRFKLFGRIDDFYDALHSAREALAIARSSHGRDDLVQCLTTLARCLGVRGRLYNIEEAIFIQREVVSLSPDDWASLRNLACSIHSRQCQLQQPDGFEEVIIILPQSLALIPAGHAHKLTSLADLAAAALARCQLGGGIKYQEEALEICRENVAAHGQFEPDNSYCLAVSTLADACWIKGDYEEAVTHYEQAANLSYATPRCRFEVTTSWASRAMQAVHSSSLRTHTKAMELLDQCLTSTPTIDLQHQFSTKNAASALASNAAACAIEEEELETAVQVLEGRALFWSHMRGYRHSIEKLQELNPGLTEELKGVCQQLEHLTVSSEPDPLGMTPIPISTAPYAAHGLSFDAKVTKNRQLSEDYERIISENRQLDGFSNFLQATPFSTLQTAASEGPVILVNVSKHRSDAVILRATETPLLVPLSQHLPAEIHHLSAQLLRVDEINRTEERRDAPYLPELVQLSTILEILWFSRKASAIGSQISNQRGPLFGGVQPVGQVPFHYTLLGFTAMMAFC